VAHPHHQRIGPSFHTYLIRDNAAPSLCAYLGLFHAHCTATYSLRGGAGLVIANAVALVKYLDLLVVLSGTCELHFFVRVRWAMHAGVVGRKDESNF